MDSLKAVRLKLTADILQDIWGEFHMLKHAVQLDCTILV